MELNKLQKYKAYSAPMLVEIYLCAEGILCVSGGSTSETFNRVEDTDGWDD